jgi:hypothetical protein
VRKRGVFAHLRSRLRPVQRRVRAPRHERQLRRLRSRMQCGSRNARLPLNGRLDGSLRVELPGIADRLQWAVRRRADGQQQLRGVWQCVYDGRGQREPNLHEWRLYLFVQERVHRVRCHVRQRAE